MGYDQEPVNDADASHVDGGRRSFAGHPSLRPRGDLSKLLRGVRAMTAQRVRLSIAAIAMMVVLVVVVIGVYSWLIEPSTQTHKARELIEFSQLKPHTVKSGETWWGYARKINPGDIDPRAIVHELKVINREAGYQSASQLVTGYPVLLP